MLKQVWNNIPRLFFMHQIGLSSASGIGVVTGKAGNNTVFFVWMPLSGEFLLSFLSVRIPFAYHFPFPLKILLKALNTRHFVPSSKPKQYCSP